jgi:hypothetical protein
MKQSQCTKVSKPRSSKREQIIKLKQDNPTLTTREIGKLADCNHSNVVRTLALYNIEQQEIEQYKKNRSNIFAGLQSRILKNITNEDIEKASLQVKAMAFGVLYDKERLENGQSTDNVSIISTLVKDLRESHNANDND